MTSKKSSLANSMAGAKSRFDDRLQKAESLTLASSKEKVKPLSSTTKKTQKKKQTTKLDSFTFPQNEHNGIQKLIIEFAKQGIVVNKSEVIRLRLHALNRMNKSDRSEVHSVLQHVKVGRPPKK